MIEAVVFDLGGTLVEYAGAYGSWPELETPGFAAAHAYLEGQGVAVPEVERFRLVGFELLPRRWQEATAGGRNLTVTSLLADVLAQFQVGSPAAAVLMEAARQYQAALCTGARPIAHGRELLAHLKSKGYKLGLISNTMFSGEAHLADLEKFGLAGYFDTLLFSADAGKWKPNAAAFDHVLDELDVQPAAAVFIGDDPAADVVGGRRAGMRTIHFPSSQRFPSANGIHPDATVYSLQAIPGVLVGWKSVEGGGGA
ncbi:MAG: HAD family hydrolase [Chloroflexi bacterium]|nr:HAD family hydrolase [Chloroflexota bacterium]MCI0649391.1 HAD family hydrolase [Chloroflexota bacterium]MCI0727072.1 HAD family hydrolase [Chloroflexota bacterium]